MAEEARGLPYYSTNPTGVGAVYFGNNVDLLGLQQEQDAAGNVAVDKYQAQQAAKKKIANDMLGDPSVSFEGIMDVDAPYFKEKATELSKLYQNALMSGQDPANPAFLEANTQLQLAKQKLLADVEQSKAQKQYFVNAAKGYDPTKHDDMSLRNQGAFRISPFEQRSQMDTSKLLVPKKQDFGQVMDGFMKNIKPSVTATEIKLPSGQTGIEKLTNYTTQQASGISKAVLTSPEKRESAQRAFDNLPVVEQQSYIQRAGATGDPIQLFVEDYVVNLSPNQQEITQTKYSPMQNQYARLWGDQQKDKEAVDYLVERFGTVLTDDEVYKEATPELRKLIETSFPQMQGALPEIKTTGVLSGLNLGKTSIPIYAKLQDGTTAIDGLRDIDNRHLYFVKVGEDLFAVTTKSQILNNQGVGSLLVPVNEDYLDDLTSSSNTPLKVKEQLKVALTEKGYWDNGKIKIAPREKVIPATTPTTTQAAPAKKTATRQQIKGLIGKKGYEGYTENELIEYYKSQGYTIE